MYLKFRSICQYRWWFSLLPQMHTINRADLHDEEPILNGAENPSVNPTDIYDARELILAPWRVLWQSFLPLNPASSSLSLSSTRRRYQLIVLRTIRTLCIKCIILIAFSASRGIKGSRADHVVGGRRRRTLTLLIDEFMILVVNTECTVKWSIVGGCTFLGRRGENFLQWLIQ